MAKVKNRYPTNNVRNTYSKKRKKSTIETPLYLADYIFKLVLGHIGTFQTKYCIDVGCHHGNLSLPFKKAGMNCLGYDNKTVKYHSTFCRKDFLQIKSLPAKLQHGIVVCNPPFNISKSPVPESIKKCAKHFKIKTSPLLPELFLRKIFEKFGVSMPVVFIAPMGLIKNQRMKSSRWKWLRDCGAEISGELELPIDAFGQGILVHSSVLFFNIYDVPAKTFLGDIC